MVNLIYCGEDCDDAYAVSKLYIPETNNSDKLGNAITLDTLLDMKSKVSKTYDSKHNNDGVVLTVLILMMQNIMRKIKKYDIDRTLVAVTTTSSTIFNRTPLGDSADLSYVSSDFTIVFRTDEVRYLDNAVTEKVDIHLTNRALLNILELNMPVKFIDEYKGSSLSGVKDGHKVSEETKEYIEKPYITLKHEIYLNFLEAVVDGYDKYIKAYIDKNGK